MLFGKRRTGQLRKQTKRREKMKRGVGEVTGNYLRQGGKKRPYGGTD
jgi:hypothetical protein